MTQAHPPGEATAGPSPSSEGRVVLRGVPWKIYEALTAPSVQRPGTRMSYLGGELEIMTPSPRHERRKSLVGRLIEAYAEERDLVLNAYGSTTFKDEASERGAEPDECYVLREIEEDAALLAPDLVIEVVESSWRVDKLEIYRGLGVPEVWLWRPSGPEIHVLEASGYIAGRRSRLLPDLDLDLLASFSGRSDQTRAVKEYRERLGGVGRH